MKKLMIWGATLLLFCLMGFAPSTQPQAEINWIGIEEAEKLAKEDGKKILIDFYTSWCGWCKRMDATTYKNPEIIKYINENYHAVKFDGEFKGTVTVKGHEFKFVPRGRRGYNELTAAVLQGKLSYPATAFMSSKMDLLSPVFGYQPTEQFMPMLKYFGDDAYLDTEWQKYMEGYRKANK